MFLNCGVGEDSWESLGLQGDPVHPKGDQSWMFIGRTDVEAETPVLWPPDMKSWLIWKDPDAGNDWGQEEKGTAEDEIVGWHHRRDGHGFGWTPKAGDGQGGLMCCDSWGHKESDTTELNWTDTHTHTIFGLCADSHLAWFHFPSTTGNNSVVNPAFNSKIRLKIAKNLLYSGELANKKYWKCLRGEK